MNNSKQAKQELREAGDLVEQKTPQEVRRAFIEAIPAFTVTAICGGFLVLVAGTSAFGQVCNFAASCPATCLGCTVDCDPNLADKKALADCPPEVTGGGQKKLSCTSTTGYTDDLRDVVRYEQAYNTVKGTVRVPEVGNLPIKALFGNTVCTDADANVTCNPADGTHCAFPCLVGAAGFTYSDPITGLTLQGLPSNGLIQVRDDEYMIQPDDVGILGCQFTFVSTDIGTSCCSNYPKTCDETVAISSTFVANYCGNGVCESGEDCSVCPDDCISFDAGCGNGICEPSLGENCVNCLADCNGRQSGKLSARFCCGDGDAVDCDDARCVTDGFACSTESGELCCGASGAPCTSGAACCSNICSRRGLCK